MQVQDILAKDLVGDEWLTEDELRFLMSVTDEEQLQLIYKKAYEVKAKYVKPVAYYRGLIEFSNRCIKNCNYCGIRRENDKTERFDMNREDIIKMAQWAYDHEYGSITLQSGERCDDAFVNYVVDLIRDIKAIGDGSLGITMCVGEQSEEAYRRMREAGASRYLLRIETTNKELYHKIHPQDELHSFETRVECLRSLRRVGFQVGTGVMIGLPGQTEEDLVNDILFYRDMDIDMIGMGPYVVHHDTPLGQEALAMGIDDEEVKSVSNSTTLSDDFTCFDEIKTTLYELVESVCFRCIKQGLTYPKTATIWVRDNELQSFTRQKKLYRPTVVISEIYKEIAKLLNDNYVWNKPIRSIGVGLTDFEKEEIRLDGIDDRTRMNKKLYAQDCFSKIKAEQGEGIISNGMVAKKLYKEKEKRKNE